MATNIPSSKSANLSGLHWRIWRVESGHWSDGQNIHFWFCLNCWYWLNIESEWALIRYGHWISSPIYLTCPECSEYWMPEWGHPISRSSIFPFWSGLTGRLCWILVRNIQGKGLGCFPCITYNTDLLVSVINNSPPNPTSSECNICEDKGTHVIPWLTIVRGPVTSYLMYNPPDIPLGTS